MLLTYMVRLNLTGNPQHKDIKTSILAFFSLLSISEPDVHTQLVSSTIVIPALVFFLSQLTSAFWEDDADLLSASSEEVSLYVSPDSLE